MKSKILGIISLEDHESPINSVDVSAASKGYHSPQGPGDSALQNLPLSSFTTLHCFTKFFDQMEASLPDSH